MTRALVMDFETTGLVLHPKADINLQPRAIEFGAAMVEDGVVLRVYSFLINPGIPLEPIITKITGLTDDDLRLMPPFSYFVPQLREAFAEADILVAHNLPFDREILRMELARCGEAENFPWPPRQLCTVAEFAEESGKRPSLKSLYERTTGAPLQQTHRALDDVMALVEILEKQRLTMLSK